jgi:hypothetical protein
VSKTSQKPFTQDDLSTTIMDRDGNEGETHENIGTPAAAPQRHTVASVFAAANELLSLSTSTNEEGAEIEQKELQASGTCESVVQVPGDTPPSNEKGEKVSLRNGSGSGDEEEFLHEKQKPPAARQTVTTENSRSTAGKGELPEVCKIDSQQPKVQKVQVDDAFQALPSYARRFLPTQGITTPEEFLETNAPTIAKALMNWRIKNRWDLSECSFINAQYCIYKWKSKLRGHPAFQESSKAVRTPPTIRVDGPPGHLDEELSTLSPLARRFLPSHGITTADAFLATGTKTIAEALMKWRKKSEPCECTIKNCREAVLRWKRDLHEQRHNLSGQQLRKVDADLKKLSSVARAFLSFQGIANAAAFRSTEMSTLTNALVRWREREKMSPLALGAARIMILNWKKESQQVEPSKSQQTKPSESQKRKPNNTKKRKPSESQMQQHSSMVPGKRQSKAVMAGLDQAFEILSAPVQSFFLEHSILTPALLLQQNRQELARVFVEWRDRNGTRDLKLGTAMSYVSEWRQISLAKLEAPPSCPDRVTTLAARTNIYSRKRAQLPEGEDARFGEGTESRSTQGSRASSHASTAAIRNDADNMNQRKRPPTEEILHPTTELQLRVQNERNIADVGTVASVLPLQADAVETANLHHSGAHAHAQPAYKASVTVSSLDDESGTTLTQKRADNRSACNQLANAAIMDTSGEPQELSNDGNCYLSFLERDAIRFLTSCDITTAKSLLETNSKELAHALMEARRGSTTFSSSYSSSYQHVYRWKRIVRQRQAADSDHLSLNMLPSADQKLLASVGITTADAFLNMKPTTLAHSLIESRQRLNMKPWAFSTARQVIYRWIAVVRPKESIPIPAQELLAEEPEERPVGLDPVFKNLSSSDQWFLAAQSIMTAHDLMKVGTKELAHDLAQWKREKTRRDFKMSSATIYIGRWKGLVRSHVDGTETTAASSLNAEDTAGISTGSGQRGTRVATSTVVNFKGTEFPGTEHQERNDVDYVSDNTDESLGTTNASAESVHATYPPYESSTPTKIDIDCAETHTGDILDTLAPTDAFESGQSELGKSGKIRRKVAKRTLPWVQLPPARAATAGVDEGDDSSISYTPDNGAVQDVNSLVGTDHGECGDTWTERKRKQPRTENAPSDSKSGSGISSIAPFVTNMKTFSYW